MEKKQQPPEPKVAVKEGYSEPLLLKHEPLRNITGSKYGEKTGAEKGAVEHL